MGRQTQVRRTSQTGTLVAEWSFYATGANKGLAQQAVSYNDAGVKLVTVEYDSYDTANRLTHQTWTVEGAATGDGRHVYAMAWTYAPDGAVKTMRYPADMSGGLGETVTYQYVNATGQPERATGTGTYAEDVFFNARGQLVKATLGGAVVRERVFDGASLRLGVLKAGSGGSSVNVQRLDYWYDDLSGGSPFHVSKVRDYRNHDQRVCFEYWSSGELQRAFTGTDDCSGYDTNRGNGEYDATYWYDDLGNIDQVKVRYGTGAFTTLDYQYTDGNHPTWLTQVTGGVSPWSFGYNGAGGMDQRTVDGPTQTLDYDARNRLVAVTDTAGASGLVYDADGNRIVRKTPTTTTVYVGDLYERTTSGTETKRYVVGGVVVSQRVAGTLDVVVGDHLGSTSATYDTATGAVAKQWFEAFGAIRASVGDVATDVGYTGQRLDNSTGLMFYRARSYDPVVGRFAQPDTIVPDPADHRDLNRYTYVRNCSSAFAG